MKKQEIKEGLVHLRIKQNLLSMKEFQDKNSLLEQSFDKLGDNEDEVVQTLGMQDFYNKNKQSLLQHNYSLQCLQSEQSAYNNQNDNLYSSRAASQRFKTRRNNDNQTQKEGVGEFNNYENAHQMFIKKMKRDNQQRKLQRDKTIDELNKNSREEEEEKIRENNERKYLIKHSRFDLEKFLELKEKIKSRERERSLKKQREDMAVKEILQKKPLFLEMENQYKILVEDPQIQQRQEKLQELQFIKDFSMRGKEIKVNKIIEEEYRTKEERIKLEEGKKKIHDKMRLYFEKVKEVIPNYYVANKNQLTPIIQTKKENSIQQRYDRSLILGSASQANLQSIDSDSNLHSKRLPSIKNSISTSRYRGNDSQDDNISRSQKQLRTIVWKSDYSIQREEQQKKEQIKSSIQKKDYLREVLQQNNNLGKIDESDVSRYIRSKDLSSKDKMEIVHMKAKKFEELAKFEEKYLELQDDPQKALEKQIEVNNLYMKSLNAKIQMINPSSDEEDAKQKSLNKSKSRKQYQ
ncbi:UNKNOWN [Stylonychia lemnae]|uniref:Uncharacterized protein n=1 Tax=Stylonychia lemnae TaxID=5949 RepID=A0A078AK86_STYLE|nr:UNKNOWN [Stylonychia lemnae]|eukprot:CDW81867.1 UNKNOWN [Stylonychia lemnae]